LHRQLASSRQIPFKLYLITDRKLAESRGGLLAVVEAALSAASTTAAGSRGVAVQLREKDLPARDLYELARALLVVCARYRAPLLVNDRVDVAIAAGADGVHLAGSSYAVTDARTLLGPARLIGISTHAPAEIAAAAHEGADFAVYGPVFAPLSKPGYGSARGAESLGVACRAAGEMPVLALGGITAERVAELGGATALDERSRAAGAAVIGAVMGADNPGAATRALLAALARW
jgi:thiamine-phosphate pyrophosphorylase